MHILKQHTQAGRFAERDRSIEAIQVWPGNLGEVFRFLQPVRGWSFVITYESQPNTVVVDLWCGGNSSVGVGATEWIVKKINGDLETLTDKRMREKYDVPDLNKRSERNVSYD